MHKLQQHILQQLILNSCLNYAKLKPAEVEGNLFTYHLRQLLNQDLIAKNSDNFYELTPSGQVYADRLSLKTLMPRVQPHIVTLLAVENSDGQWLMYRRLRQPLINLVGFPYGKVHLGETIAEAAKRELNEKTGLTADLTHRGDGYITIYQNNEIASQIFFHLFYGHDAAGKPARRSKVGEAFWAHPSELPSDNIIPSVPDLIDGLEAHPAQRFFIEETYKLGQSQ